MNTIDSLLTTFELDLSWYETYSFFWEPIQLGLILGFCISFPLNPAFLIPFRQSLLKKRAGFFCLGGTFFSYFLCLLVFLFSPPTLLQNYYYVEPLFTFLGLCTILRFAGSLGYTSRRAVGPFRFQNTFWETVRRPVQQRKKDSSLKRKKDSSLIPEFAQFSKMEQNLPYAKTVYNYMAQEQVSPLALVHTNKPPEEIRGPIPKFFKYPVVRKLLRFAFIREFAIRLSRRRSKYTRPNAFDTITPRGGLYTFGFKPGHVHELQDDDGFYFILGFFLVFANPMLWLPFPTLLYSIQFDHLFDLLVFGSTGFVSIIFFTLLYFFLFRRFFPPLFFGEVTRLAFFIDSLFAFLLITCFASSISQLKFQAEMTDVIDYINNSVTHNRTLTNLADKYLPARLGTDYVIADDFFERAQITLDEGEERMGIQDQEFQPNWWAAPDYKDVKNKEKIQFFEKYRTQRGWGRMNERQRIALIDIYEYNRIKRKTSLPDLIERAAPLSYRFKPAQNLFPQDIGLASFIENYTENLPYLRGHALIPNDQMDFFYGEYFFDHALDEEEDGISFDDEIPPSTTEEDFEEIWDDSIPNEKDPSNVQNDVFIQNVRDDRFVSVLQRRKPRPIRISSIGQDRVYFINPQAKKDDPEPVIGKKEPTSLSPLTYKPLFRFDRLNNDHRNLVKSSPFFNRLLEVRSSTNATLQPIFNEYNKKAESELRAVIKPSSTFQEMIPQKQKWIWDLDENQYIYPSKYYVWGCQDLPKRDTKLIQENFYQTWELDKGLKAYPGFSSTRVLPVSDEDFTKLRSDLLIYRKLLKTEFY